MADSVREEVRQAEPMAQEEAAPKVETARIKVAPAGIDADLRSVLVHRNG